MTVRSPHRRRLTRLLITCVCAAMASLQAGASAEPLTADELPPSLLAECDERAQAYGRYAPPIADAAGALIRLGVFKEQEFQDAKIGFCDLKRAGGPVAATSCDDGVILLDEKYASPGEALNLKATLAHEMMHHLQHRSAKARFGPGYCAGARYQADKPALEKEADAFGDRVAALLALGRDVEVVNACNTPVAIYLEADDPVAVRGSAPVFLGVPAGGAAIAGERALSGGLRFYAETAPKDGVRHVWQDKAGGETRMIEGRLVRLKRTRLAAADRADGPFRLRLTCPAVPPR